MSQDNTNLKGNLGIVVGGGPAPGINGVISAVTIEAIENGLKVIGIEQGQKWLTKGDSSHVRELKIADVSWIHYQGGSILGTSRENLLEKDENGKLVPSAKKIETVRKVLEGLGISYLVTIGGDDTALSASLISKHSGIKVAHVPKTIDNDLPLPGNMPTFGFETARHVGAELVHNLMEDSRTTSRWYFVVAMGRTAGHLALGIGKTTGATITIIPEEFKGKRISLDTVCDALEGAILKRLAHNRDNGVAVIAEGIADKLDQDEMLKLLGEEAPRDEAGHIRLAEVPIASILKRLVQARLKKRGMNMTIVDSTLGYELRCAPPIPFDREYTRDLGYGAVRHLLNKATETGSGAMISIQNGCLVPIPFENILNAETGRTSVRTVNLDTDSYRVARAYMIRLERTDFEDEAKLVELAEAGKTTPDEFRAQFGHLVGL